MKVWKEVNIGSLGKVITGNTPLTSDKEFYGGSFPFIKPTDMDVDRRRVSNWEENYSDKAFKKFKNAYIPAGSTGVVTIGTVGEKIFQANQNCFTNQSVNVVIPNEVLYDKDFVYYLLKYNLPKVSSANPGTASGRHHVSKSNFCSIRVIVPDNKSEQRKIGSTLSAYDDLIENNLKRIKLLEELAQRIYEEWFVKFRLNGVQLEVNPQTGFPHEWTKRKIILFCEKITDGTHDSPKPTEQGYKLITGKHLMNGFIDFESAYLISEEDHLKIKKRSGLLKNDILFSNIGTLGNVAMVNEDFEYSCKNMIIFRPITNHEYFLYAYLMNTNNKQRFLGQSSGSTQKFISLNYIRSFEDYVPPRQLIQKFNNLVKSHYNLIFNLISQNRLLKESRDILLPRLMRGKIEVQGLREEELAIAAEPGTSYKSR
jgi:type I restriction enzyme S subunit